MDTDDERIDEAYVASQRLDAAAMGAVHLARDLSRQRHDPVGTDDLLRGLLADRGNAAGAILRDLGVTAQELRVAMAASPGANEEATGPQLPAAFTLPAGHVFPTAVDESVRSLSSTVGADHLLLALLRVDDGHAWAALRRAGIRQDDVRRALMRLRGFPLC